MEKEERMKTSKRIAEINKKLENIKNYKDVEGFLIDLDYQIGQLAFFYDQVVPRHTGEASTTIYWPKYLPREHQIAYFNLTRGFPKELYGGHWCYVYKYFKNKVVIIPTTSIKATSLKEDKMFHLDIKVNGFTNQELSRLQLSDIRTVDIQRLYEAKGFYNVVTKREVIVRRVKKILGT